MNPNQVGGGVLWVYLFLARTFFLVCSNHFGNQQNRYCIDCEMAACQRCIAEGNHAGHRVLTIYRLVYKDVVSVEQISRHIDCSRIQPYSSNGRQVLALHPLPHYNSGQIYQDRACLTCTRILMNPNVYSYCSIACKLYIEPAAEAKGDAGTKSGTGAGSQGGGSGKGGGGGQGGGSGKGGSGKHSKRSNSSASKRKGVPRRSPLF